MSVRAAVLRAPGAAVEMAEVELDAPHAGEVEVAIAAAGVCGSDVHVVTGDWDVPMPVVLGHEGVGRRDPRRRGRRRPRRGRPRRAVLGAAVRRVPAVPRPGGRGSASWWPTWSRPAACCTTAPRAGAAACTTTSGVSSFAERVVVPRSGAIRIRDDAPLDVVAIVGCAVATGVGAVLNTAAVPEGATVAVIGCGGVGLSVRAGRAAGAARRASWRATSTRRSSRCARRVGATDDRRARRCALGGLRLRVRRDRADRDHRAGDRRARPRRRRGDRRAPADGQHGALRSAGRWPRPTSASSAPTTARSTRSATSPGWSTATWTASSTSTALVSGRRPLARGGRGARRPRRRVGPCARCSSRHEEDVHVHGR